MRRSTVRRLSDLQQPFRDHLGHGVPNVPLRAASLLSKGRLRRPALTRIISKVSQCQMQEQRLTLIGRRVPYPRHDLDTQHFSYLSGEVETAIIRIAEPTSLSCPRRTPILAGVITLGPSRGRVKPSRTPRDICHRKSGLAPPRTVFQLPPVRRQQRQRPCCRPAPASGES